MTVVRWVRSLPGYARGAVGGILGWLTASALFVLTGEPAAEAFSRWWALVVVAVVFVGIGLLADHWQRQGDRDRS